MLAEYSEYFVLGIALGIRHIAVGQVLMVEGQAELAAYARLGGAAHGDS